MIQETKMESFRLNKESRDFLATKTNKTKYVEALILQAKEKEKEIYKINLEPFNGSAREKIKQILLDEGVHLRKIS